MEVLALGIAMMCISAVLLVVVSVLQKVSTPAEATPLAKAPLSSAYSLIDVPAHRRLDSIRKANASEYAHCRPFRRNTAVKIDSAQPYVSYLEGKKGESDKLVYGIRMSCAGRDWARPLVSVSYLTGEQLVSDTPEMMSPLAVAERRTKLAEASQELLRWSRIDADSETGQFADVKLLPLDIDVVSARYLGLVETRESAPVVVAGATESDAEADASEQETS